MQIILLIWFVLLPATSYAGPMQASNFGSEIERPNFSEIQDVQTKKSAFFDYLMPYVLEANAGIKAERSIVLQFEAMNGAGQALTQPQRAVLLNLAKRYRLPTAQQKAPTNQVIRQVLERVDVLPMSLVLAQAANESGWGSNT